MTRLPSTERDGGLSAIADDDGVFAIIAMDQRNTLRRMFEAAGRQPDEADMRTAKVDVARALTPLASGILLDPARRPGVDRGGCPGAGLRPARSSRTREAGHLNGEPRTHRDRP
jgi:hypothetical protein